MHMLPLSLMSPSDVHILLDDDILPEIGPQVDSLDEGERRHCT